MRNLVTITLSLLVSLLAVSGCTGSECDGNRNSLPLAGFMSSGENPQPVSIDTLYIAGIGAPADSVLSVTNDSQAYIPFNIESHTTSYVFRYNKIPTQLYDTVTFTYDIDPMFVSSECGVIYKYNVKDITYTTNCLDSVTCPKKIIDNTPGQNIFIYFKTEE